MQASSDPVCPMLKVDLTDFAQVMDAMQWSGGKDHPFRKFRTPDAVVHFAAIPAPDLQSEEVTFRTNITSTYNVFDAALRAGVVAAAGQGVVHAQAQAFFNDLRLVQVHQRAVDLEPLGAFHPGFGGQVGQRLEGGDAVGESGADAVAMFSDAHRGFRAVAHDGVLERREPIREGRGRIRLDDTFWLVAGPDLPSGTRVKIVSSTGRDLVVEEA